MPEPTDTEREKRVRESIDHGRVLPVMAALLRLLDAERARADAAEAKVASAFKRGYDAGIETANSDWP